MTGGGLFLLAAAVVATAYEASPSVAPSGSRWLQVRSQPLENQLGLVGRIEADKQMTLSAPFDGVVQELVVADGRRVECGQRLLSLDTAQLDIQVREALAAQLDAQRTVQDMRNWPQGEEVGRARRALANAQLGVSDSERKLAETRRLLERGIVARMEVDALEQQLQIQQLDLAASQAELRATLGRGKGDNLRIAEMQLSNAQARYQALSALHVQRELRAPFDGIVLRPQKSEAAGSTAAPPQPGLRVTQGMPLYELVHLERIKTVARVEEADLRQLSEGMPVQITGDGFDGITLQGRIAVIGVQGVVGMSGSGTTYEVTAAVDPLTPEQRRRVRLGMSARMAVVTYRTVGGLALPAEALRDDGEGRSVVVYRADSDEAPQQISVTTGRAVPQGVEVFGLKPGYVELPASN